MNCLWAGNLIPQAPNKKPSPYLKERESVFPRQEDGRWLITRLLFFKLKEVYSADISHSVVANVMSAMIDEVAA